MSSPQKLGDLEQAIMSVLWSQAPLSVRDVLAKIRRQPKPAYTTVMTVLDRLFAKGVVDRVKDGKAFLYEPRLSQAELAATNAWHALGKSPTNNVLMAFLDSAEKADPQVMERLQALIAARRGKSR